MIDMEARPRCRCHGEPMHSKGSEGWRCRVAAHEAQARYRRAQGSSLLVPVSEAQRYAERLVKLHGGTRAAGERFDERHHLRPGSGERLLERILSGQVAHVTDKTLDRLWVML